MTVSAIPSGVSWIAVNPSLGAPTKTSMFLTVQETPHGMTNTALVAGSHTDQDVKRECRIVMCFLWVGLQPDSFIHTASTLFPSGSIRNAA